MFADVSLYISRRYYYERSDSNISSPLFTEKNKNSGVCYKFRVPEFLWKKGVSQIFINTKVQNSFFVYFIFIMKISHFFSIFSRLIH